MSEQKLRDQLYASFKHRARLYYLIFDQLRQEVGESRAIDILQRAIRRRGEEVGRQFSEFGPDNLVGLRDAFLAAIPDDGHMFSPKVERCDADRLDITLTTCPLKDAWMEDGLDGPEIALMCRIAAIIDNGTFEAAGFQFSAETWQPDSHGCCHLHIRPGKPGTSD